jgi:hypothetical protein
MKNCEHFIFYGRDNVFFRRSDTLGDTGFSQKQLHEIFKTAVARNRRKKVKSSVQPAKKLLGLKTYKFIFVQKLRESHCVAKVRYCNWFCAAMCSSAVDALLTHFMD